MRMTKNGYVIEGDVQEIREILKANVLNSKEKDIQVEAYNEGFRENKSFRHKHWNTIDDEYLKLHWIKTGRGKRNKKIHKENKKIAKFLGRTYEACRVHIKKNKNLFNKDVMFK
jgi:hypothetical protein